MTSESKDRLVADANVVAKWFLQENSSEHALRLFDSGVVLYAPDPLISELGSIFRGKMLNREMTREDAEASLAATMARVVLVPSEDLFPDALSIAIATRASFYDCLYVTLAVALDCRLVTDDRRLVRMLGDRFGGRLWPLEQYDEEVTPRPPV